MVDRSLRTASAVLSLAALVACSSSTHLTSSWVEPSAVHRSFREIVIVCVTSRSAVRRTYEDDFVADLAQRGVAARPSYALVGEGPLDKDAMNAKLREVGADAVLVTR